MITAELSGNQYLGPDCRLELDQEAELAASGWELEPDAQGNWALYALTDDEIAARLVAAIRDVLRVVHPSLLAVDNVGSFADGAPGPDVGPLVGSNDPDDRSVTAEPLPHTLCHGDTYPTNFKSRRAAGGEQTVALDWALVGIETVGDDLGQLVFGAQTDLAGVDPVKVDRTLFESYINGLLDSCLLYTSPSPRDRTRSRMPSSA